MTTTMPRQPAVRTNGSKGQAATRISSGRVKRVPWVALGVVLVIAGALIFGLMIQSAGDRTAVVVAARDISQGQVITTTDLRVVDAAIDGSASTVPASQRSRLIGQMATSRIPAGALVSREQFSQESGLALGEVVVGALLGPGGIPVPNLRVGDDVTLLEARDTERSTSNDEPLGNATVFMVTPGTQPGTQFVSLAVPDSLAQQVTDAAAAQRLRLVLRRGSSG